MSFLKNLEWRYATKKFDGKKVSDESLKKITEAIRLAPTSAGVQPFHVTIVTNPEIRAKLKEKAWGQEQITSSSHLLVFSARTDLADRTEKLFALASAGVPDAKTAMKGYYDMLTGIGKRTGEVAAAWSAKQAYIALGFGLAACAELEIDSCPMEGFDPAGFKSILNLPAHLEPVALLAVGYRAEDQKPRPKVRFPAEDIFDTVA